MYVLIVDDEPDLIDVIRETLISEEVFSEEEVLRAGNGAEALVIFEKQRPSLVMTDLNMPKMNGSELIRQIRERSPDTEIVVMTGHGDLNSAISLFPYKIVEFLRKPFNIAINVFMSLLITVPMTQPHWPSKLELRSIFEISLYYAVKGMHYAKFFNISYAKIEHGMHWLLLTQTHDLSHIFCMHFLNN